MTHQQRTTGEGRHLPALGLAALALLGVAAAGTAGTVAGAPLSDLSGLPVAAVAAATGLLVARARPRNPVGWLLLGAAVLLALAESGTHLAQAGVPGGRWTAWAGSTMRPAAVIVLLVLVPLHFPDGLMPGRGWRALRRVAVAVLLLGSLAAAVRPGSIQLTQVDNPLGSVLPAPVATVLDVVTTAAMLGLIAAAVVSLVQRYRRGGRTQRTQVKWMAYAVGTWLVMVLLTWPAGAIDPRLAQYLEITLLMAAAGVPAAIGLALLRHHLHDVDLVISRTLVYGTLTVAVVTLYVVAVGYLGALLQTSGSLLVSLLATGVVAVAFSPLRERLQRAVNRLLYGDRDDPYAALDRLGRRLEDAATPQDLLDLAAAEVAAALRLPYAAIELVAGGERSVVAEHGRAPARRLERIGLHAGGTTVGWLAVGPLAAGDVLSAADRGLLDALARPVGATLHAHGLTADLQRSREALVTAREEERSRLHRDLHDGLGPELAAVSMLAEAAGDAVRTDPARAEALLDELVERAQQSMTDLRSVVHALRPPALDALGLVGALRARAATHTRRGLRTDVDAPGDLPLLEPAVEVAVYRIAMEALTNVARHAGARRCAVHLAADSRRVLVEVVDDGRGMALDDTPGIGLRSMQTRAAELGGHCAVAARPEGGTTVSAWLPLPVPDHTAAAPAVAPGG